MFWVILEKLEEIYSILGDNIVVNNIDVVEGILLCLVKI